MLMWLTVQIKNYFYATLDDMNGHLMPHGIKDIN